MLSVGKNHVLNGQFKIIMEGDYKGKCVSLVQNTRTEMCRLILEIPYGNVGQIITITNERVLSTKICLRKLMQANIYTTFVYPESAAQTITIDEIDYSKYVTLFNEYPNKKLGLLSAKELLENKSKQRFCFFAKFIESDIRNGHLFINVLVNDIKVSVLKWNYSDTINFPVNISYLLFFNVSVGELGDRKFIRMNKDSSVFYQFDTVIKNKIVEHCGRWNSLQSVDQRFYKKQNLTQVNGLQEMKITVEEEEKDCKLPVIDIKVNADRLKFSIYTRHNTNGCNQVSIVGEECNKCYEPLGDVDKSNWWPFMNLQISIGDDDINVKLSNSSIKQILEKCGYLVNKKLNKIFNVLSDSFSMELSNVEDKVFEYFENNSSMKAELIAKPSGNSNYPMQYTISKFIFV